MLEAAMVMRLKKRSWAIVFAENARQILYNLVDKSGTSSNYALEGYLGGNG
jgi:hypothetical protein